MDSEFSPAASTLLAILIASAFALVWGGVAMMRRGDRQKGVLMLICAVILLMNVLIWTV